MKLTAHLQQGFDSEFIADLEPRLGPEVVLTHGSKLPEPADYEILISGRPAREFLTAAERLRVLIIPWSGLPVATRDLLLEFPDIAVHNIHHNAAPAAEMALALLLAAAKEVVPIDRQLRQGDWQPRYTSERGVLLEGKTAVVLGLGAIGTRVAGACQSLGMKVVGIKKEVVDTGSEAISVYSSDKLLSLLPEAQVLFVTVPLTSETEGLLGEQELARLPDGAIVINVARGPIIDEAALFAELRSGRLRAGLDVWYRYPDSEAARAHTSPSKFPFAELANVVMTPHLGGHTDDTERLRAGELAHLLNLAAEGKPLPNRIDLKRGY